jgi:hypothetical protein
MTSVFSSETYSTGSNLNFKSHSDFFEPVLAQPKQNRVRYRYGNWIGREPTLLAGCDLLSGGSTTDECAPGEFSAQAYFAKDKRSKDSFWRENYDQDASAMPA